MLRRAYISSSWRGFKVVSTERCAAASASLLKDSGSNSGTEVLENYFLGDISRRVKHPFLVVHLPDFKMHSGIFY